MTEDIDRWIVTDVKDGLYSTKLDKEGDWVKYDDHIEALQKQKQKMIAKMCLTWNDLIKTLKGEND